MARVRDIHAYERKRGVAREVDEDEDHSGSDSEGDQLEQEVAAPMRGMRKRQRTAAPQGAPADDDDSDDDGEDDSEDDRDAGRGNGQGEEEGEGEGEGGRRGGDGSEGDDSEDDDSEGDDSETDYQQDSDEDDDESDEEEEGEEEEEEAEGEEDEALSIASDEDVDGLEGMDAEAAALERQRRALSHLRDEHFEKQEELAQSLEMPLDELRSFVGAAVCLRVMYDLDTLTAYSSPAAVFKPEVYGTWALNVLKRMKPDILRDDNMPTFDAAALGRAIEPLRRLRVDDFTADFQELLDAVPDGGAVCKVLLNPRAAMSIVVAAHALTSAKHTASMQQAGANDLLEAVLGTRVGMEQQTGADGGLGHVAGVSNANDIDHVLTGPTLERVNAWVGAANQLTGKAFVRRVVRNVAQLSNPSMVRHAVRSAWIAADPTRSLLYSGHMDDAPQHHAHRRAKTRDVVALRVIVAVDGKGRGGELAKLGVDTGMFRLRERGIAGIGHRGPPLPQGISQEERLRRYGEGSRRGGIVCFSAVDSREVPLDDRLYGEDDTSARAQLDARRNALGALFDRAIAKPLIRSALQTLGFHDDPEAWRFAIRAHSRPRYTLATHTALIPRCREKKLNEIAFMYEREHLVSTMHKHMFGQTTTTVENADGTRTDSVRVTQRPGLYTIVLTHEDNVECAR